MSSAGVKQTYLIFPCMCTFSSVFAANLLLLLYFMLHFTPHQFALLYYGIKYPQICIQESNTQMGSGEWNWAAMGLSGREILTVLMWNHMSKYLIKKHFCTEDFFFFFLAALGLCCCPWALSSCGEQGLLFIVVHGLLIAVASLVAELRL